MANPMTKKTIETAIEVVQDAIDELQDLQKTPDKSREIAVALTHLETAEMWLSKAAAAVK